MFRYSLGVDNWSHKMIVGLDNVWGKQIEFDSNKKALTHTRPLLGNYLDSYFKKNGEKIFEIFYKLTGLKHAVNDFDYFLNTTTVSLHNYRKHYISVGAYHSFASYPTILIHELFHLFFYEFSEKFDLTDLERNEIKEIITVIINYEFVDFIDVFDIGYPQHEKIRSFAGATWEKDKNFYNFVNQVIGEYKKAGARMGN